jgi:hypothetical protein
MQPVSVQNEKSIRQFILEKKIDSTNIYLLRSEFIFLAFKESINRAFLYDKNGMSILYDAGKENKKCLGNIWSFLMNYQKTDALILDTMHTFDKEWSRWITIDGKDPEPPTVGGDFTIVYYWNTFSGNTNHRDFFKDIEEIMRKRPDLEIVFYKINQDMREGMDLEKYTIELLNPKDSLMKPIGP